VVSYQNSGDAALESNGMKRYYINKDTGRRLLVEGKRRKQRQFREKLLRNGFEEVTQGEYQKLHNVMKGEHDGH